MNLFISLLHAYTL